MPNKPNKSDDCQDAKRWQKLLGLLETTGSRITISRRDDGLWKLEVISQAASDSRSIVAQGDSMDQCLGGAEDVAKFW